MGLEKNESSQGVIRSVAHSQHPTCSGISQVVYLFRVFGFFPNRSTDDAISHIQLVKCTDRNSQIQDWSYPTTFHGHNEVTAEKP